jgi:hypothetical protein
MGVYSSKGQFKTILCTNVNVIWFRESWYETAKHRNINNQEWYIRQISLNIQDFTSAGLPT